MFHFVRYCVSHCLHAAMTRLEEVNGEVSMWSSVRWLGYLSGLNLLVALFLGLYTRWERTSESILLVIFILALLVLGIASVLHYYNRERISRGVLHLCYGFLLGLLSFLSSPAVESDVKEQAVSYMLLVTIVLRTLWALLERLLGCARYRPAFLTSAERLELTGFAAASLVFIDMSMSVIVLVVALATVMVALRMKALLAFPNLIVFAVIASTLFVSLDIHINPFAVACFFIQLICDPLLDVYFSGLSVTERWQPFLVWSAPWRLLSLLPLLVVELIFLIVSARMLTDLDHGYLRIPGFVLLALLWSIVHMVFLRTVWVFHTKLSECQRLCSYRGSEISRLDKVMASTGMRYFCLLSERLVVLTLTSTVVVAALCWQVRT